MLGRHESAVEGHAIRLTFDEAVARVTLARPPLNILSWTPSRSSTPRSRRSAAART
jgi:hypothetical protein